MGSVVRTELEEHHLNKTEMDQICTFNCWQHRTGTRKTAGEVSTVSSPGGLRKSSGPNRQGTFVLSQDRSESHHNPGKLGAEGTLTINLVGHYNAWNLWAEFPQPLVPAV